MLLWVDDLLGCTIGLWFDSQKFNWVLNGKYQELSRGILVLINRQNEDEFEFKQDLQARVDSNFNLMIRGKTTIKDYDWYLRLSQIFDVYRLLQPPE
jgi:hypothetical protein